MSVRVRYAPSPTGLQHIGGLRTALFNYLFARANGGKFFLRIEDTDQGRYNPEAEQDLYDTLRWAGLDWDEGPDKGGPFGPYVQSQRLDLYQKHAAELAAKGLAYPCYCTSERLDALRKEQEAAKLPTGYDGRCFHLTAEQKTAEAKLASAEGRQPVLRFRMPREGHTIIQDMLLGEISHANVDLMPDPVLLKSDGFPTYHLAHVVDDHLMQTTHVLRAREWLPSAPLHLLLFQAFGWTAPEYCHMPLILGADGQKLSKRHGSTSVKQFKDDGYLPEAVVNYLSLLGWSYDDSREFFTLPELEKLFDLKRLSKAGAVFDYKRLEHFNSTYLRQKTDDQIADLALPVLVQAGVVAQADAAAKVTLVRIMPLIKERISFVKDIPEKVKFFFKPVTAWDQAELIPKKLDAAAAKAILQAALGLLGNLESASEEETENLFRTTGESLGFKLGDFMHPVRVAVSGSKVAPPMFGSMKILGAQVVEQRLRGALAVL